MPPRGTPGDADTGTASFGMNRQLFHPLLLPQVTRVHKPHAIYWTAYLAHIFVGFFLFFVFLVL